MNVKIDQQNDSKIAIIESPEVLIQDVQDALDVMATIQYNYDCNKLVIQKSNLTEEFFELRTRLAGEILQKFVNYNMKLAIVGNFEEYNSKSLRDFIYECRMTEQKAKPIIGGKTLSKKDECMMSSEK